MSDEEGTDIIFETDTDQSNEEFEEISTEPRKVYSQAVDDRVYNLYRSWKKGNLIVQPDFQRQYVWDAQKATSLIESALLGIPLPVIYLAEEDTKTKSVIDGQQRLTSFFSLS